MKKGYSCEGFLKSLLHYNAEISDVQTELTYWCDLKEISPEDANSPNVAARKKELMAKIKEIKEKKLLAAKLIDAMEDPVARCIYRGRYVTLSTWKKIAEATYMSERNAHYIHDTALPMFEAIYARHTKASESA